MNSNNEENPIISGILRYLEPQINCVLLCKGPYLFLIPNDEFYPVILRQIYTAWTNRDPDKGPIIPISSVLFSKYDIFSGKQDYCASNLAKYDRQVNIRNVFHIDVLYKIFNSLVMNIEELNQVKDLATFIESKIPFTGDCYHEWLHYHLSIFD